MNDLVLALLALKDTPVAIYPDLRHRYLQLVGALAVESKPLIRDACKTYVSATDNILYGTPGQVLGKPRRLHLLVSLALENLSSAFNLEANYAGTAKELERALVEFTTPYPSEDGALSESGAEKIQ